MTIYISGKCSRSSIDLIMNVAPLKNNGGLTMGHKGLDSLNPHSPDRCKNVAHPGSEVSQTPRGWLIIADHFSICECQTWARATLIFSGSLYWISLSRKHVRSYVCVTEIYSCFFCFIHSSWNVIVVRGDVSTTWPTYLERKFASETYIPLCQLILRWAFQPWKETVSIAFPPCDRDEVWHKFYKDELYHDDIAWDYLGQ